MITASAPGKLILLGEYAVLEGAPALVAAVDRRAAVRIETGLPSEIRVTATDLGIHARATVRSGALTWDLGPAQRSRLRLVETVLRAMLLGQAAPEGGVIPDAAALGGLNITLSTAAFFDAPPPDKPAFDEPRVKLGLGSSAAVTVALAGALRAHLGLPAPTLAELVRLHRAAQDGRGSGADIGASLAGGVIAYRGGDTESPTLTPTHLPSGAHWCCVFTGRPASTSAYLARLAEWRIDHPDRYAARMSHLADIAEAGAAAAGASELPPFLDALAAYADGLDGLGSDAGIDIMSDRHRAILGAAADCGVLYKPSGAGGGDIGVGFSGDPDHIQALRAAIAPWGYRMIDMSNDRRGLTVDEGQAPARVHHEQAAAGQERQR
jgi:phosphomevalonate kinase